MFLLFVVDVFVVVDDGVAFVRSRVCVLLVLVFMFSCLYVFVLLVVIVVSPCCSSLFLFELMCFEWFSCVCVVCFVGSHPFPDDSRIFSRNFVKNPPIIPSLKSTSCVPPPHGGGVLMRIPERKRYQNRWKTSIFIEKLKFQNPRKNRKNLFKSL